MKTKKSFTLIDIVITLVIVGSLVALSIPYLQQLIQKSKDSEAVISTSEIRKAEIVKKMETGSYISAESTEQINSFLSLGISPKNYEYRIGEVRDDNFLVIAKRKDRDIIVVAMDKDGIIYPASGGGGVPGSGGGYVGGGSGGLGGGSIGGSSGGGATAGSAGGSSGGGSTGSNGSSGSGDGSGSGSGDGSGSGSGDESGSGSGDGSGSGSGDTGSSGSSGSGGVSFGDQVLNDSLSVLNSSQNGQYFYNLIQDKQITVAFYDLGAGILAQWIPSWWLDFFPTDPYTANTIYIDDTLKTDWTKEAIAALIIHEALHADYTHNTEKWVTATLERYPTITRNDLAWYTNPVTGEVILTDSIDQEYNAFTQEAIFWKEVKAAQANDVQDYILALYEQGGSVLYIEIALTYLAFGDYPPYAKEL
ncbi:MAG: hypothetical protein A3J51_00690 [Omnitrophica WOR_2 bacterium RIFCSPHIGHO2_02_FULL_45_21]|nr:MAG: hypothetical protein A3J51_00690 [Omnitrophica WOR_2 bacterium RIFCSPHIGHO2_02_FULL_45_21]